MSKEKMLVCLSSSPSNMKVLTLAVDMAKAYQCELIGLYVKTPSSSQMIKADQERLERHMAYLKEEGFTLEIVNGDHVSLQIAEFASNNDITKVIVGKSTAIRSHLFYETDLTEQLMMYAPNIDILIIPDRQAPLYHVGKMRMSFSDLIISFMGMFIVTIIGFIFKLNGVQNANVITLYILAVLIISVITSQWIYGVIASIISVIIFNYLFIDPIFSFHAYDTGYLITFGVMFVSALISSSLASQLKKYATASSQRAFRTKILLDTNKTMHQVSQIPDVYNVLCHQIRRLLERSVILQVPELDLLFVKSYDHEDVVLTKQEDDALDFVLRTNQKAGSGTNNYSQSSFQFFPIHIHNKTLGVFGVSALKGTLDSFEESIMIAMIDECALEVENRMNERDKNQAELIAKNEQTRANLLRAISHDLRTPLTSIYGNASHLLDHEEHINQELRQSIYQDLYDDSLWLINTVENLLAITRLEEEVQITKNVEIMEDVVDEALRHVARWGHQRQIIFQKTNDIILCDIDSRLIVQVLVNLIDNAIKYTNDDATIIITMQIDEDVVMTRIIDDGPGLSAEDQAHIFERFYIGTNKVADGKRSLGLGLSVCKTIIEAHQGKIWVENNIPHGAVFSFTLPVYYRETIEDNTYE